MSSKTPTRLTRPLDKLHIYVSCQAAFLTKMRPRERTKLPVNTKVKSPNVARNFQLLQ